MNVVNIEKKRVVEEFSISSTSVWQREKKEVHRKREGEDQVICICFAAFLAAANPQRQGLSLSPLFKWMLISSDVNREIRCLLFNPPPLTLSIEKFKHGNNTFAIKVLPSYFGQAFKTFNRSAANLFFYFRVGPICRSEFLFPLLLLFLPIYGCRAISQYYTVIRIYTHFVHAFFSFYYYSSIHKWGHFGFNSGLLTKR